MQMLKNYFFIWTRLGDYRGRASRKEYWSFVLFHILVIAILYILILAFENNTHLDEIAEVSAILIPIYTLISLLPSVPLAIRRAHDNDRPWYFVLIPVYNIILMLQAGDSQTNRFGPPPGAPAAEQATPAPGRGYIPGGYGGAKNSYTAESGVQASRFCTGCGNTLAPGDVFCGCCGQPAASQTICSQCGSHCSPDQPFCTHCGRKLT